MVGRGRDDAPETLASDIVAAGAGASSPRAARLLSEEGPRLLQEILVEEAGIPFDRGDSGQLIFGREGAHSRRRVVHVGDSTGLSIIEGLMAAAATLPQRKSSHRLHGGGPHHVSTPLQGPSGHLPAHHLPRRLSVRSRGAPGPPAPCRIHGAGHRRPGQDLPQHHQPHGSPRATALPWPIGPAPASSMPSTSSSIPPRWPLRARRAF